MKTLRIIILLVWCISISTFYLTAQTQSDTVENCVKIEAKFRNGDVNDFRFYIDSIVKYPELKENEKLLRKVVVEFMIDSLGDLTNIKILKSLRNDFDEAIITALKRSPKWTPAKVNNRPVSQRFVVPFHDIQMDFQQKRQ